MGRGEAGATGEISARGGERSSELLGVVREYCSLDVSDSRENKDGDVISVRAAIYDQNAQILAEGEWSEVGIPGDEESYDSALGWSCSTAELNLQARLRADGLSEETAEEAVELNLSRSDMPVY